jgi:RNA polymerase sigma factor (TIGR02999 family)
MAEIVQARQGKSRYFPFRREAYNAGVRLNASRRYYRGQAVPRMQSTVGSLITSAQEGDRSATEALFTALYDDLHRLARRELSRRGGAITLTATALLHEAYLELAKRHGAMFVDRGRFMAYASRVMRGLIIDYARERRAQKRGGRFEMTTLETEPGAQTINDRELVAISDALDELAVIDPSLAEVVDLKFFCGFSFGEIAGMRGLSERTVQRQWDKARIFLHGALRDGRRLS